MSSRQYKCICGRWSPELSGRGAYEPLRLATLSNSRNQSLRPTAVVSQYCPRRLNLVEEVESCHHLRALFLDFALNQVRRLRCKSNSSNIIATFHTQLFTLHRLSDKDRFHDSYCEADA